MISDGSRVGPGPRAQDDPPNWGAGPSTERRLPVAAVWVHVATLVVGFGVWMYLDRHLWFYGDEWDFILRRGVFHAQRSLWVPHNEHWSTLPILAWRAIFSIVHLRYYWPYLTLLLLVHVACMHLVWRRCLRLGVNVWVATTAVLLLGLLGTSYEDLTWAFQIGFLGSVMFGLLALDLLDRSGASLVTDVLAVAAVECGLMCSDIGLAFMVGFGVVALALVGWRRATAMVAVPLVSFVVWYLAVGKQGTTSDKIDLHTFLGIPRFDWHDVTVNVTRLFSLNTTSFSWLGPVVFVLLVLAVLWRGRELWRDEPVVIGLLVGDLAFHTLTALGRDHFGTISPSRYGYIDAALLLPILCYFVGGAIPWKRLRPLRLLAMGVAVVVLLVATGGNLYQGAQDAKSRTAYVLSLKTEIIAAAQVIAAGQRGIQMAPIPWAYLPPSLLQKIETDHLVPKVHLSRSQWLSARSRVGLATSGSPQSSGRFALISVRDAMGRPAGPGCETIRATKGEGGGRAWITLALHGQTSAAVKVELSRSASVEAVAVPSLHVLPGEDLAPLGVPGGGRSWLTDVVAGERLVVSLPPTATLCALSGVADRA